MYRSLTFILLMLTPLLGSAQSPQGYYRYPTIYAEAIVFTSEGDLWQVGFAGGTARRLTTHPGMESHASISPDGKLLAFSAQYEGPTEVYTMPLSGGLPSRKTFEGETALTVGWTPDGKILYTTRHYSTLPNSQLAILNPKTLQLHLVPLSQASDGVYEPTQKTLFFTRLPFQGSRTKRYKGGTVQNLWKFTEGSPEAVPLTKDYPGTSKAPMWWEHRIYFASDRDGTMNLWSMNEDGQDLKQHTFHKGWDIQSPDLYGGKVVYQSGADLYLYDIAADRDQLLKIYLTTDFEQTASNWVQKPMDYLTSVRFSPDGDKIALTARGRVFVAPVKEGRLVEATRKQGVRFRNATFLPDGKSLLLLSDETGEFEFWKLPANGVGPPLNLTQDGKIFRNAALPSPDGKWFAYTDRNQQLWLYNMSERKQKRIAVSDVAWGNFSDLSWSPDSQWLAFGSVAANDHTQISLYHIATGRTTFLTSDRVDSYSPAWSPNGEWLYFLSDRHFRSVVGSPWGPRQPEPFYDKTTKIYIVALAKKQRSPFQPDDELSTADNTQTEKASSSSQQKSEDRESAKNIAVNLNLEGIQSRVMEVPVRAGNYYGLSVNDKKLFFIEVENTVDRKQNLLTLEIDNPAPKPKTLVENIKRYELSLDGKNIMIHKENDFYVIDANASAPAKLEKKQVDLKNWTFLVNPKEEWRQMFVDAWRMERDYFYDPNLHGVDWDGLLKKHLPLVERVADRSELNDLISQIVGELSALHMNVRGGEQRRGADHIRPASLGAVLARDDQAGGYRIDHIYQTEPDYLDRFAPLARPDLNIQEGDVILAINGVPTLSVEHPNVLLNNQAGEQVLLRIKSSQTGKITDAIVAPISQRSEYNLRYDEWEYTRRLQVEKLGEGEIGYVHLRAMGGNNYSEWVRNFYPVYNRKGLIIDVRHNRGGNIDSWILEKLLRKAWFYWKPRVGKPYWNMQYAFRGHIVVLCNERTASDGEAFAEGFRRLGLGKVIGTRTWGGEIWLSNNTWLVDRGIARVPQTGVYGPEGAWLIEGHGVEPDIEVDNLPHATFQGQDAQLEAAINFLQEKIKEDPVAVPQPPPYPNKAFDYQN